ncbi:hypothetical protein ABBQ38_009732 [Trebouxia sp. C0009 RCD-2024]
MRCVISHASCMQGKTIGVTAQTSKADCACFRGQHRANPKGKTIGVVAQTSKADCACLRGQHRANPWVLLHNKQG